MEKDQEASNDSSDYHGSVESVASYTKHKSIQVKYYEDIDIIYLRRNGDMSDTQMQEEIKKFAAYIQKSETYQEYLLQRERLKKQPGLYDKVNEYRQRNFDIQNETDSEDMFDRMEAFEQEYEKFRENPLVEDFLRAELAFCRMMQDINVLLTAEIDFE